MKTYTRGMKIVKYSSIILFVVYLSYLIYLTFFAHSYGRGAFRRKLEIIPFETTVKILTTSNNWHAILINIVGNIVAFMPMGFLLPFMFDRMNSFFKVLSVALIATVSIEVFQYITGKGTTDIDDVILNALGGILGYLMAKGMTKLIACLNYK
jgi:glycopeptide antibiotics resistance protein